MPGLTERLLYRVAKRWIAGYNVDDAIRVAHETNKRKIRVIINRLGEDTPDPKLIEEYNQEYHRILELLEQEGIDGTISVKPSQLGLATEASLYKDNLSGILEKADMGNRDVWIDMEGSSYTEATLQVYKELFREHRTIGVCLQANLKRTENDLQNLLPMGARIRLVKGAYPEKASIAYKNRAQVDSNYLRLLQTLFQDGDSFVVGTHDMKLIAEAEGLSKEHSKHFEFQMLKGIRDDLKDRLVNEGYRVGEYIPYGPEWYNYSKRRIRERKRNMLLLLRSITG